MWFFGLIVVLLIGAVAVVASGRWGAMGAVYDDRPDMTVPARQALTSVDIESARFAVGVRGYRMDEVDTLLERVAKEVAERDRRIADLERAVAPIVESPEGHGFTSAPYDTADFDDTGTHQPILVGGEFPEPSAELPPTEDPEPTTPQVALASATPNVEADQSPELSAADGLASGGGAAAGAASGGAAAGAAGGGAAAGAAGGGAAAGAAADDDETDEPPTSELPRASRQAADEYERLQAEARAVLEAQSQPGPPRRTPAPTHPTSDDHLTRQQPALEEPAPEPALHEPAPESALRESAPEPVLREPAPESTLREPAPESTLREPAPEPALHEPAPEPALHEPAPESTLRESAPEPVLHEPAPEPVLREPAPEQPAAGSQVGGVGEQPSVHWTSAPAPQSDSRTTRPEPDREREPQSQDSETQNHEPQDPEPQDPEPQDPEPQDPEPQQPDNQAKSPEQSVQQQSSYEQSAQAASYEHHTQQQAGRAGVERAASDNGVGNGAVEDEGGEGWRFWPPADQDSDGAYQRPS